MSGRIVDVIITISCPQCGHESKVKSNRLNQRMKCLACESRMYVDEAGKLRLGDPPVRRTLAAKWEFHIIKPVSKWVGEHRLLALAGGAATITLLVAMIVHWLAVPPIKIPLGLGARSFFVGESIYRNDIARLHSICARGTHGDARTFLTNVRREFTDVETVEDPWDRMNQSIIFENREGGIACVQLEMEMPVRDFEGSGIPNSSAMIVLMWKIENGFWLFDATATKKLLETGGYALE